jgi:imidazolonepropionase-like amidohydrolase
MERAGLSPIAVINAATGNSAGRLGYKEEFGRIEPGGLSRFIVADDSPLDGLSNLRKPKLVVFDGLAISNTPDVILSGL